MSYKPLEKGPISRRQLGGFSTTGNTGANAAITTVGIPHHRSCNSIYTHKTNDEGTLSQETILKIQELKMLVYRYPIYSNPDGVVKCVTYFSINGDNTFLDEKLEELRNIHAISKY